MTLDQLQVMYDGLKEEGKDKSMKTNTRAFEIFMESYQEHKDKFGSFKHLEGAEYCARMSSRYQYMYNKALEYIRTQG